MADLSDAGTALVALAAQAVYPNGTGQASVAGTGVVLYPGWPNPQQLDADLKNGKCHVSVYPRPEERNTTRYPKDWQQLTVNTPTLTLTVSGQTITVAGTIPPAGNPHNVIALVNKLPAVYAVQVADTLNSIATALSSLIAGATSIGAVITVPATAVINATRVGVQGSAIREIRRQERVFQISVWADTPAHRDAIAAAIDVTFSVTQFLMLVDTTAARLVYKNSVAHDEYQKDKLYRRDLFYTVEYATTQTETETQITIEQTNVSNQPDGATAVVSNFTINQ